MKALGGVVGEVPRSSVLETLPLLRPKRHHDDGAPSALVSLEIVFGFCS